MFSEGDDLEAGELNELEKNRIGDDFREENELNQLREVGNEGHE